MDNSKHIPPVPRNIRDGHTLWVILNKRYPKEKIDSALEGLPDTGRFLIRSYHEEGRPIREIAAVKKCSQRILRERLGHAMFHLHKYFFPEAHRFNAFDL